ncbi:hypothetical protein JTE90_028748 [Oedothorax gibbosus]|uniref:Uncharacterized protein n=1 Tax=Oedothorax gibbosus TaxID=931172 RepID=A0AAV6UI01_9ARAC|nr:hypothetical protein JTE90_028748 [Oedothorax gibbosus]
MEVAILDGFKENCDVLVVTPWDWNPLTVKVKNRKEGPKRKGLIFDLTDLAAASELQQRPLTRDKSRPRDFWIR